MKFETALEKSMIWGLDTLRRETAKDWQECVRAEAAAVEGWSHYWLNGLHKQWSELGYCTCVTCGAIEPWNKNRLDGGHFLSRSSLSVLFEPLNCHPQCKGCNMGSKQNEYRAFMLAAYGPEIVDGLEVLKRKPRSFTREELVTKRREFRARTKAAIARMEQ